ncbi:hypothetical protein GCM10012289_48060 [Nonomuraea cavernae]|uniref:WxL domain-containing protein n=2 Tax=Nonomuraea cavernae TaxID=2045107 RepID=A0A918DNZ0_9ACTN|nr:hypothetical protein GCM10012289_48060 [Nonomuraea cavernae]
MLMSRFVTGGIGVAVALAAVAVAMPAGADICPQSTTCPTTVTFAVSSGDGLTITVPNGPVSIGGAAPGGLISGPIGTVTVDDTRAALSATWTATVSATSFTTGGGTPAETVPASSVFYWSGPATSISGAPAAAFVPGQPNAASRQSLNNPRTAFSKVSGSGNNSASWAPTIEVDVPAQAVAGTYTGTVNHSVA